MRKIKLVIGATLSVLILSACSQKTAEEKIIDSQNLISQSKYSEAIIILKDVVVNSRENVDARSLLADAYYGVGDFVQAEKELKRILSMRKLTPLEGEKLIVSLYFLQRELEVLDVEVHGEPTDLSILLKAYVGFSSKGQYIEEVSLAEEKLKDADSKLLLSGLVSYSLGKNVDAIEKFDAINNRDTYFPFLDAVQGMSSFNSGQNELAVKHYDKVLETSLNFDLIKLYKSEALVQAQKFSEAKVVLDELSKKYTKQPVITKLLSIIDYSNEDYVSAKRNAELAIQYGLSDPTIRGVAALSSMLIENYEVAYQHFQFLGEDQLEQASFNAAYLYTKLQLGYEADVANALLKNNTNMEQFPQIAASTLERLLDSNQTEMADKLGQSVINSGASGNKFVASALLKMGNVAAIETLENQLETNPSTDVLYTLVSYYFNNQEFTKAKSLSLKYLNIEPDSLLALQTLMLSHASLDETNDAQKIANKIQGIQQNEAISANFLAMQQLQEGNYEASFNILKDAIAANKLNLSLLKTMREINLKQGAPAKTLPFFEEAYQINGQNAYRFWYAQALADAEMPEKVVELLNNYKFTKTTPRSVWVFLSDAYTNVGKNEEAVNLLLTWVKAQPDEAFAYVKLLSQPKTKTLVPNIYSIIKEGLLRFTGNDLFSLLAVQYAIDRNDSKLADSILKSISPEIKESPLYRNQYGRYLLLTQQYEEALPYLKGAYESEPSFFHLSQVNNAYLGLLKPEDAISYIDKHLESTPEDALAKMLKADVLMWTKPDEAIEEYKKLLKTYPKNAVAMNNVAWLYMQKDDYNMARTYALQAVDLFPKNSNFLDTLALTYLKEKDFTTASSLLKVAVENNPSDINVYFNYAESLYGQGKSGDAVATLKRITTTDPKLIEIIRLKIEKYR